MLKRWLVWLLLAVTSLFFTVFFNSYLITPVTARETIVQNQENFSIQQGLQAYQTGNFLEAITIWKQALLSSKSSQEKAEINSYLAQAYRQIGKLDQAIIHSQNAIEIYQEIENNIKVAQVSIFQAQIYRDLGQNRRSITILQDILELDKNNPDPLILAQVKSGLGNAYWALGSYENAVKNYQESLQIAEEEKANSFLIDLYNDLGNFYYSWSKKIYFQVDVARNERERPQVINQLIQEAETKERQAIDAFQASLKASNGDNIQAEVRALLNLNEVLSNNTEINQALITQNSEKALELLKTLPDSREKTFALIKIALSFQDTSQSINLLEESIKIAENIGDSRAKSFALGELGSIYEKQGNLDLALQFSRQASLAAQEVNATDSLYRWQWQTGRLLKATGDPQSAIGAYQQAIASLQQIRGDIVAANKEIQFDFRDDVEPIYRQLMALLLDQDPLVANQNINQVLQTLDLLKLAELQNFFGDECVQIAKEKASQSEQLLQSKTVTIYSIILDDHSELILESPDHQLKRYSIAKNRQEIEQEINNLRLALEDRTSEEYSFYAQEIYNLFIKPLETDLAEIKPDTLVFINDGELRKIPMAALYDGEKFLIEKYAIATTPSLTLTSSKPLDKSQLNTLIMGLSVEREGFAPLAYVQQETEKVQQIIGGKRLLNEAFTLANFQTELQEDIYPIVHLATHGQFGINAENTFLLGFDTRISIEEMDILFRQSKTFQNARLLTLSACQTAAGDNRAALGIAGVAVRAGVESAVATLWSINDAATVPLIEEFYHQLVKPETSIAEALRQSQIKMIANVDYNHPALWSPFILIGNWL